MNKHARIYGAQIGTCYEMVRNKIQNKSDITSAFLFFLANYTNERRVHRNNGVHAVCVQDQKQKITKYTSTHVQ